MRRILVMIFFAFVGLGASWSQTMSSPSSSASAAAPQTARIQDPVTAALRAFLPRSRNNILGAITAMPAEKFNYKPTPDQMTFAHLIVHTIGSNNALCAKVADIPAPKAEEVKETDAKDKLLPAATASFDFCGEALGKMDDSKLGDAIELFGRQGPRAMAA